MITFFLMHDECSSWPHHDPKVEYTAEQEALLLEDGTYETVSRVRFNPIADDDGMSVTCHAVNDVMEEGLEASEEINILFAPRVVVDEGGQSAVTGSDVTMDCQVEANPANLTHLEWLKNGVVVEGERFTVEDTVLTIIDVEREDAGDYRYKISTECPLHTVLPELHISHILGVEPETLLEKDYQRDFIPLWSSVSFLMFCL